MGHDDLQQRDGGGDGGKHHQQIEQDAEQSAQGHFVEHILHGHKQQGRAAQSAGGVQGETAGDNAQTGHQGHQSIHDNDEQSVLLDVFLFMQVGAVGDHGAHAQGQGEEHLAAGGSQDGEEVRCFLNDTVLQSPAGNEHILQAVHSAGQGAGADDADEQDDEQSGHTAAILGAQSAGGAIGAAISPSKIILGTTTASILGSEGEVLKKIMAITIPATILIGAVLFVMTAL